MNRQRLMELAGISRNFSTPSEEPNSEIPSAADEIENDADMPTDENDKSEIIKMCMAGLEDEQDPKECLAQILSLLKGGDEVEC